MVPSILFLVIRVKVLKVFHGNSVSFLVVNSAGEFLGIRQKGSAMAGEIFNKKIAPPTLEGQ
ncbi:MAG: hypothetical protein COX51_03720 [Syntrophobacteraceae bacterium CG23_combo_of_CG06-09_8_20_14_all_50_8]|nr:MAG: hypothetical protein COX51_03720 [Syntrophobacteraceae bacterium CG23_combo_of_CG06-09_8_20_14_all_50_8]